MQAFRRRSRTHKIASSDEAAAVQHKPASTPPRRTSVDLTRALSRQLRDGGATVREVEHLVPVTGQLREAVVTARGLARLGGLGRPLAELQVARPAVRNQNPIVELQDRIVRLHRASHQLTRKIWVGVCTLADPSVAGLLLNDAAAKVFRAGLPADVVDLSIQWEAGRFEVGAAAWLEVQGQIRVLRTSTPAVAAVRDAHNGRHTLAKGDGDWTGQPGVDGEEVSVVGDQIAVF